MNRRPPFLCHYFIGSQGTTHGGPPNTASCCSHLGRSYLPDVQFPSECFQNQEWWLSFLAATLFVDEFSRLGKIEQEDMTTGRSVEKNQKHICTIAGSTVRYKRCIISWYAGMRQVIYDSKEESTAGFYKSFNSFAS